MCVFQTPNLQKEKCNETKLGTDKRGCSSYPSQETHRQNLGGGASGDAISLANDNRPSGYLSPIRRCRRPVAPRLNKEKRQPPTISRDGLPWVC